MVSPKATTSAPTFKVGNKVTINDPELDLHPNTVGTVVEVKGPFWPVLYIPGIPFGENCRWPVDPQYLTRVPRVPVGGIRVRRIGADTERIKHGDEGVIEAVDDKKGVKLVGRSGWFLRKHFEVIR
ncbi:hypothetical protein NKJ88_05910 [Mesorhizobium sp. M0016]|uniref:hypothetical protein n=1 Tax=Mesorhizobium sp. M0016 TaxID=2956843 RepID=UPI0033359BF1